MARVENNARTVQIAPRIGDATTPDSFVVVTNAELPAATANSARLFVAYIAKGGCGTRHLARNKRLNAENAGVLVTEPGAVATGSNTRPARTISLADGPCATEVECSHPVATAPGSVTTCPRSVMTFNSGLKLRH